MLRNLERAPSTGSRLFAPALLAIGIVLGLAAGQAAPLIADAMAPSREAPVEQARAIQALGPRDDYATRHPQGAEIALGARDDYGLRHALGTQLGPSDDYGLRHAGD
jgi:hypothetical protein